MTSKKYSLLMGGGWIALALLVGCDTYTQDDYVEEYVVESYLVADSILPELRLSTTAPASHLYRFEDQAVRNAQVAIHLLDATGNVETAYAYQETTRGVYTPINRAHLVVPLRTYALEITFPNNADVIRAQTLVPGTFSLVQANRDTVVYQSSEQLETRTTRSMYPGRQAYYVFTIESLDPDSTQLTPFFATQPLEDRPERFASPLLNEENYTFESDGTITIRLPWLAIVYYGPNRVIANTLDDNLYDFIRSRDVQLGGSTLSPGEIQNIFETIEGGTGIFGSYATNAVEVFIKSPFIP